MEERQQRARPTLFDLLRVRDGVDDSSLGFPERLLKERVSALVGEDLQAVEKEIGRQLDSPVGLIANSWGGMPCGIRLEPLQ